MLTLVLIGACCVFSGLCSSFFSPCELLERIVVEVRIKSFRDEEYDSKLLFPSASKVRNSEACEVMLKHVFLRQVVSEG